MGSHCRTRPSARMSAWFACLGMGMFGLTAAAGAAVADDLDGPSWDPSSGVSAVPLWTGSDPAPLPLNGPGAGCGQITTPNGALGGLRALNGLTCQEAKAAFDRYLNDPARANGGRWQLVSYDDGWTCLTTLHPGATGPSVGGIWKECELDLTTGSIGQTPGNPRAELDWLGADG